jgi:hypothetical protein
MIACDLIGLDLETSDRIRKAIAAEHRIPMSNVLLACTHTHSGPASESLRGCGEPAPEYVARLPELIQETARRAAFDRRSCQVISGAEYVEPIGFNRRFHSFQPVDPKVSAIIFNRAEFPICMFSYSCHAVALGRNTALSADWPGAAARAMEANGYRCICFQGFCGDIDPVSNLNKWGAGAADDLLLYGAILKRHLSAIAQRGQAKDPFRLTAIEDRISLPLEMPPDKNALAREYETWHSKRENEAWHKFVSEWHQSAREKLDGLGAHPYLGNAPIQAMQIGGMSLIALPGEIFCEYGLKLRAQFPALMTVGYGNGNTGYWPVKEAYDNPDDYAAYLAPKIYYCFPFAPALENITLKACQKILSQTANAAKR